MFEWRKRFSVGRQYMEDDEYPSTYRIEENIKLLLLFKLFEKTASYKTTKFVLIDCIKNCKIVFINYTLSMNNVLCGNDLNARIRRYVL